jgi:hypothetical protein
MKKILRLFGMVVVAAIVCVGGGKAMAQAGGRGNFGGGFPGGGNFDMSQMMKLMVDNMRESFEVTDDNEWGVIAEKIQKVNEARMQIGLGGGMGMSGMMGRRGGMGGQGGGNGAGGRGGLEALFGSNPEGEALQRAIEAKAPSENLKAAIEKFVEARKKKQATLEKAQTELRQLLSVRQEAIAFSLGLL